MVGNDTKIIPTFIEDEMQNSYLDYSMSVIVSRALPDVRDGLKPVHRRVIFGMNELGLSFNRAYKKSARIVGEVMGKYHPHGDAAIYDTLVRMAQDFSMRYVLVDGQGNFGSIDGDAPAAMRYTEARLSRIAGELIKDIDKETVDFRGNFDDSEKEPVVLPSGFPNLLINGSTGIAVGMATNIPPHNLKEVVDAICAMIDNPDITIEELVQYIQGPDFPTGGIIFGRREIFEAYKTGRGKLCLRAMANIEKREKGRDAIIVTEIPYQVNKNTILEKIAELVETKKIEGISEIRDESDRDGMRIVIEIKKDAYPEVILNQLYKNTPMQSTFGIIMIALVNNEPKVMNLKQMMAHYVDHRLDVLVRRTRFDLTQSEERAHILEGLKIALGVIDEVIVIIKKSKDNNEAKTALMSRFKLSEKQAHAILEMKLQQLTGLEREKIEQEYLELIKTIEQLNSILESETIRMKIIKDELLEIKKRYGDERQTEIVDEAGEFTLEDIIAKEDMVIVISKAGYIKRLPVSTYKTQGRGGQGVLGMDMKEEDITQNMFIASTHSFILCFTNLGRCYWLKVFNIPVGTRIAKGKPIVNLLELKPEETIAELVPVKNFEGEFFIVLATKKGVINKMALGDFSNVRRDGINVMKLDQGDGLIDVCFCFGNEDVILGTKNGMAVRFNVSKLRQQGRYTRGVRGVTLEDSDEVVKMLMARQGLDILSVTENGFGKRTLLDEYRLTNRGGKGVINIQTTERNGMVVGLLAVEDEDEIMIMSTEGTIIRMPVRQISQIGRNTQGVRLINLKEGHKVKDITKIVVKPR